LRHPVLFGYYGATLVWVAGDRLSSHRRWSKAPACRDRTGHLQRLNRLSTSNWRRRIPTAVLREEFVARNSTRMMTPRE